MHRLLAVITLSALVSLSACARDPKPTVPTASSNGPVLGGTGVTPLAPENERDLLRDINQNFTEMLGDRAQLVRVGKDDGTEYDDPLLEALEKIKENQEMVLSLDNP